MGIRGRGTNRSLGPSFLLWTIPLYVDGMSSYGGFPILAWSFPPQVLVRHILGRRRLERAFGLQHVAAERIFEIRALLLSPIGFLLVVFLLHATNFGECRQKWWFRT